MAVVVVGGSLLFEIVAVDLVGVEKDSSLEFTIKIPGAICLGLVDFEEDLLLASGSLNETFLFRSNCCCCSFSFAAISLAIEDVLRTPIEMRRFSAAIFFATFLFGPVPVAEDPLADTSIINSRLRAVPRSSITL